MLTFTSDLLQSNNCIIKSSTVKENTYSYCFHHYSYYFIRFHQYSYCFYYSPYSHCCVK